MTEEQRPADGELVPADESQELSAEDELTVEELAGHDGQALPEREAMSSLNLNISGVENFAMPINEASALNYNSSYSVAAADADQTVIIGQVADAQDQPAQDEPAQAAAPEAAEGAGEPAELGGPDGGDQAAAEGGGEPATESGGESASTGESASGSGTTES